MNISGKVFSILGASCLAVFATAAPASADTKPCCYNNGDYFNSSPSTCRGYGGRVVEQQYCQGGYYDNNYQGGYQNGYQGGYGGYYNEPRRRSGVSFSIQLGDVVFGYNDGYYDRYRRWHSWRNSSERDWYRQHHRNSYYEMRHDRDGDRNRRDWRDGRRHDWRDN